MYEIAPVHLQVSTVILSLCNCWLWNFLRPPHNLLYKKADKKEEDKNLSKAVLTFLGMAFLLGLMNDCGEIILELERNLPRSSNSSPLFYKSRFPLHYISIKLKIQSAV